MLDPDDRDLAPAQLQDGGDQLARLGVGQAAADLVEQQHHRISRQRARQLEALAVEQAEGLGAAVRQAQHAAQLYGFDAARMGRRAAQAAARGRRDEYVFEYGHAAEGPRHLVRAGDAETATLGRSGSGHIRALEVHAAGTRAVGAREHVEQRGLAGPVRTDDAYGFVGGDGEADLVEYGQGTEALADALGRKDPHRVTRCTATTARRSERWGRPRVR